MALTDIWFILIAVLWTGYLVLDGFDLGVGMLLPLAHSDDERRLLVNTIGPVWDGNEVWLLVAGGATFAAFPAWYATMFSGFYLAFLLLLVALIIRGVAFEYRSKINGVAWRRRWDIAITVGSTLPALLLGVALANVVHGVPIDRHGEFTGTLLTLLNPYGLLGGLVTLSLFAFHGALFIALKTEGDIRHRARAFAAKAGLVATVLGAVFLLWTQLSGGHPLTWVPLVVAALALVGALAANARGREGWAFLATCTAIAGAVATMFGSLYPDVLPSTTNVAYSLTTTNASSSHYTLTIMTWVAVVFTPLVLLYQGWTYWVFRSRIGVAHLPPYDGLPPRSGAEERPSEPVGGPGRRTG
jgi:cytochrome bd ubiquinol oxidase subunit II